MKRFDAMILTTAMLASLCGCSWLDKILPPPPAQTEPTAPSAPADSTIKPEEIVFSVSDLTETETLGQVAVSITKPNFTLASADAAEVIERIKAQSAPAIIGSRMYVVNTWEDVVRIAYALHDMGMDNSTIILTRAEVGKDTHGSPMRSGKYGHYLTPMLHVGAFVESGAVYILDSLPRALENEESGGLLRSRYHFPEDRKDSPFNSTFSSARISPTIIKLTLTERELSRLDQHDASAFHTPEKAHEALVRLRARQLQPLMLYGSCVMMITLPDPQT